MPLCSVVANCRLIRQTTCAASRCFAFFAPQYHSLKRLPPPPELTHLRQQCRILEGGVHAAASEGQDAVGSIANQHHCTRRSARRQAGVQAGWREGQQGMRKRPTSLQVQAKAPPALSQ